MFAMVCNRKIAESFLGGNILTATSDDPLGENHHGRFRTEPRSQA